MIDHHPQRIFHFTIDCDWISGSEVALPGIFKIIEKHKLKPTFFITGRFAQDNKEYIREMTWRNYEIGCHGWEHGNDVHESFGPGISFEKKLRLVSVSTDAIGDISKRSIQLFRAPKHRIDRTTLDILQKKNYIIDSSIPSSRFDFGLGSVNDFRCMTKKTAPYFVNNNILEIPPSSLILPINMRLLRCFGGAFAFYMVKLISAYSKCIVFYAHPAEFIESCNVKIPKNEPNRMFYYSCGEQNYVHLELFLQNVMKANIISCNMKTHYDMIRKQHNI